MAWLSPRELQIASLIAQGLTHEEMGEALGLSPRTVKQYTASIRLKLDVHKTRHIPRVLRERGIDLDKEGAGAR